MYAYIRVSTNKQGEGVSLTEQRDAIERFATTKGYMVIKWYEETRTAAKSGRPVFSALMRDLRRGSAEGVIMHKIDRSARNFRDWATIGDLIDSGKKIEFAHDNLDLTTRGGRLSADLQAAIAADYIRNLKEEITKGIYGRLKQGLYPFAAPIGYIDTGGGNVKAVDPIKAPLIQQAFKLYATGEYSLESLRKKLAYFGLVRKDGSPLSGDTMSHILRNPFYTGMIKIHRTGEIFPGKHKQLISTTQFKRVQDVLDGKSATKKSKHRFTLSNLIRCAKCGYTASGELQKGHVYYRCHTATCAGGSIRQDRAESAAKHIMSHFLFDDSVREAIKLHLERKGKDDGQRDVQQASFTKLKLKKIESRLSSLTDLLLDNAISKEEHTKKRNDLLMEQANIKETIAQNDQDLQDYKERLQPIFEPQNSITTKEKSAFSAANRETIKSFTSNFLLHGKNVELELKKPFDELGKYGGSRKGGELPDNPRTFCQFCTELESTKMSKGEQITGVVKVLENYSTN